MSKTYFDTEYNRIINRGMDMTSGFNHIFLFGKETDNPKINFNFKLKILPRLIKLRLSINQKSVANQRITIISSVNGGQKNPST